MKAEIDQSGKIEHLSTRTVIAVANQELSRSVTINSGEKVKLVKILRKSILVGDNFIYAIFAALIFILTKNIKNLSILIIDEEYSGKEKYISEILTKLFLINNIKNKPEFRFGRIGKHSPAHGLAIYTYRKKKGFDGIRVSAKEILKVLGFK